MAIHRTRPDECPGCFEKIDGAGTLEKDPRPPVPGDVTVCAYCGAYLTYGEGLNLALATEDDLADLDPESRRMLEDAREFFARKRRGRS